MIQQQTLLSSPDWVATLPILACRRGIGTLRPERDCLTVFRTIPWFAEVLVSATRRFRTTPTHTTIPSVPITAISQAAPIHRPCLQTESPWLAFRPVFQLLCL